jgi:hypothetical protein
MDPMNHHPYFSALTCFRVQKSKDWTFGRYVVNGHYDFPCFLVLIGMTFTGQIVYASSFQRSTAYDSHIFEDTHHEHHQFDWEMNIGDGHFGTCPNFFTPIKKTWWKAPDCPRNNLERMDTTSTSAHRTHQHRSKESPYVQG